MKRILIDGNKRQFKANLHCHTNFSDGTNSPEEVKSAYMQRGYSIIAYTDHDIMYDQTHLTDENFLALKGYELATEVDCFWTADGHVPMQNLEPNYKSWYYQKRAHFNLIAKSPEIDAQICYNPKLNCCPTLKEKKVKSVLYGYERKHTVEDFNFVIQTAKENGFLVIYNHPRWSLHLPQDYLGLKGLTAVEWCNGGADSGGFHENTDAYECLLMMGNKMGTVAADDNHSVNPKSAFQGWTYILADKLDYDSVIKALENGDYYSSRGPSISCAYIEDGKLHVETEDGVKMYVIGHTRERFGVVEYKKINGKNVFETDISWFRGPFMRFEIVDERGEKACSNATFEY